MRGRSITWLMVVVWALVALTIGCNSGTVTQFDPTLTPLPTVTSAPTDTPEPSATPVLPIEEPVIPTFQPTGPGGMGALLSGELLVVGRCLYVNGNGESRALPIFPAGSASWEGDKLILRGQIFGIGDRVSMGGGEVAEVSNFPFLQAPHDSCDLRQAWVVYLGG